MVESSNRSSKIMGEGSCRPGVAPQVDGFENFSLPLGAAAESRLKIYYGFVNGR